MKFSRWKNLLGKVKAKPPIASLGRLGVISDVKRRQPRENSGPEYSKANLALSEGRGYRTGHVGADGNRHSSRVPDFADTCKSLSVLRVGFMVRDCSKESMPWRCKYDQIRR